MSFTRARNLSIGGTNVQPFVLGLLGFAALSLIWGTQFLVIKRGQIDIPPLLTAALRFAVLGATCQLFAWGFRAKSPPGLFWPRMGLALAHAISMGLLYWAQARLPSALVGVLFGMTPLFVACLAHRFVPGEPLRWMMLASLGLGLGGLVLISFDAVASGLPGAGIMALLAILCSALFAATNKIFSKRLTPLVPATIILRDVGCVVAVANGLAWAAFESDLPIRWTPSAVAAFLYLGLIGSAAASTLYLVLLRRVRVTTMAYLQFTTALVALGTGILIGHESLGVLPLLGAGAIAGGLALMAYRPASGLSRQTGPAPVEEPI